MAGETIDRVVVNLSGGYPASSMVGVEVSLNGHEVGEADLRRALAYGHQTQLQRQDDDYGRQMIHSIPTGYSIDGNRGIRDPRGMFGDQLGVHMQIITSSAGAVRNGSPRIPPHHLEPTPPRWSPH